MQRVWALCLQVPQCEEGVGKNKLDNVNLSEPLTHGKEITLVASEVNRRALVTETIDGRETTCILLERRR